MDGTIEITAERPPLRVGVAGAGRAVFMNHLPAWFSLSGKYVVTAVCDLIKERRDRIAVHYPKLKAYRRYEDMLDDPEIDLILVSFPTDRHVDSALAALAKNKWTVVESPLALTYDQATVLKAASVRARGKLYACLPGYYSPEFRLARRALGDARLGDIYEVVVRRQDYVRRDDWQSIKRCGGGATWYEGPTAVQQAVTLMGGAPAQLWGELKRVASLGDAEDTLHLALKGRGAISAYIDIGGGRLDAMLPAFELRGTRGAFAVMPGAKDGILRAIDPDFKFPRRRSSVRTPELVDLHEPFPVKEYSLSLPDNDTSAVSFWKALHESVTKALPFAPALEDAAETIRYLQVVKQASPFAK